MDLSSLVAGQHQYFQTGATRPIAFRQEQLRRFQAAIESHEEELFTALHADLHKSPSEVHTSETGMLISEITHTIKHLPSWAKSERRRLPLITKPGKGWVCPEPRGVALILAPWNFPVLLLLSPLVGALAAGNCACLKTSEHAPHTSAVLARIVRDIFPPEYVSLVEGGSDIAKELVGQEFDHIFFTGSAAVAKEVMAAAARRLTPVTLELGGKCPCIVCDDATLEITARRLVWGKFLNAGQACVAPDFVLVDRRISQRLTEEMIRCARRFYGEDPRQSNDYARIIDRRHFDRLVALLGDGRAIHGGQHDAEQLYIAPTFLTEVTLTAPVMREEIFGPILPIIEYENLEEALAILRGMSVPLALYLFTNNKKTRAQVIAGTRSGSVCVNDTVLQITAKNLPFGGLGGSGFGSYHGKAGFDCFSHNRSVLERPAMFDPAARYPPVTISMKELRRAYRLLVGE
ncbi:MAG: aldehyde dehydrogenase family protein [Chthoniobacteraceae bacterium]